MVGVASQIIFCIFLAAAIGFVAGFLIRGIRHTARIADIERLWQSRLAERDRQLVEFHTSPESANFSAVAEDVAPAAVSVAETPVVGDAMETLLEVSNTTTVEPVANLAEPGVSSNEPNHFESKLTQALSLIEKLARSQERMENEMSALRKIVPTSEFKLKPPNVKS
ncbi:MAG: hypothetical protein ABIP64_02360 [Burkholderiales bacterium]